MLRIVDLKHNLQIVATNMEEPFSHVIKILEETQDGMMASVVCRLEDHAAKKGALEARISQCKTGGGEKEIMLMSKAIDTIFENSIGMLER